MSVFMDSTRSRTAKELLLFLTLLECTRQQTNMLDGRFQHQAKMWLKNLKSSANNMMSEVEKNFSVGSEETLGELYDYMYMNMRYACEIEAENCDTFLAVNKKMLEYQAEAEKLGMTLKDYIKQNPISIEDDGN